MASPIPVLPEVPSTIVPPGLSNPAFSASSIIFTAMRSLIELPGLKVSTFARTVPLMMPFVMRLMRTSGVSPMASRMVSQIFFMMCSAAVQGRPHSCRQSIFIRMPRLIAAPTVIAAAGNKPKRIEEYAGRVNSGHTGVSVARMVSPSGWQEPGQRPEFEEITVVLRGMVRVEHEGGALDVHAGQAVVTSPGEWVRYSTPGPDGAEYVAVCLPAFSPATVHRDA